MTINGSFSSPPVTSQVFTTLSMNKACLAVIFKLRVRVKASVARVETLENRNVLGEVVFCLFV